MVSDNVLKLRRELEDFEKKIVLILHPAVSNMDVITDALYYLTNSKNTPGVFITLIRPYENLKDSLEKKGVDLDKVIFIDAVTRGVKAVEDTDRCIYVDTPNDLSDINLYIDAALSSISLDRKFVFFDSLSTLAMFNDHDDLSKFFYFLTTKMRVNHVDGVLLSLDQDQDKAAIKEISKYCDKVINL